MRKTTYKTRRPSWKGYVAFRVFSVNFDLSPTRHLNIALDWILWRHYQLLLFFFFLLWWLPSTTRKEVLAVCLSVTVKLRWNTSQRRNQWVINCGLGSVSGRDVNQIWTFLSSKTHESTPHLMTLTTLKHVTVVAIHIHYCPAVIQQEAADRVLKNTRQNEYKFGPYI